MVGVNLRILALNLKEEWSLIIWRTDKKWAGNCESEEMSDVDDDVKDLSIDSSNECV